MIKKRVEQDAKVFVVAQPVGVAPQLVHHPISGRSGIVAATREVDVVLVVRNPDITLFGGRRARVRRDLNESVERDLALIDVFIEHTIDREWCGEFDRPHRRVARGIATHHLWCDRWPRAVGHRG